jgi:hypothetical protein
MSSVFFSHACGQVGRWAEGDKIDAVSRCKETVCSFSQAKYSTTTVHKMMERDTGQGSYLLLHVRKVLEHLKRETENVVESGMPPAVSGVPPFPDEELGTSFLPHVDVDSEDSETRNVLWVAGGPSIRSRVTRHGGSISKMIVNPVILSV